MICDLGVFDIIDELELINKSQVWIISTIFIFFKSTNLLPTMLLYRVSYTIWVLYAGHLYRKLANRADEFWSRDRLQRV